MPDRMVKDGHLGGYVLGGDDRTFYPELWDTLIKDFNIKSVIDVGCGEGHSCRYFADKGLEVLAIDGSPKVLETAVFEPIEIVDYTFGAYYPDKEYDLAWCCEFVEHIEVNYIHNFLETFKACRVIAITHALPGQGGYHHVNEQDDEYWVRIIENEGYTFLDAPSQYYRSIAHNYFQKSGLIFIKK